MTLTAQPESPRARIGENQPGATRDWIRAQLHERRERGLLRSDQILMQTPDGWVDPSGRPFLNFASNDYLGYSRRPELREAAARAALEIGAGAGASRLVTGTRPLHVELEDEIARRKGYAAARLFGSGMMAATGVIPALVRADCDVFADRLAHACLLDGCRLSGARLRRFHHNDANDLRAKLAAARPGARKLVVTESIFSMDGDIAPLADLAAAAEEAGADLMIDEAHATGVWGPHGAGVASQLGLQSRVAVSMGTFSKALGAQGGFICCDQELAEWLLNAARTFIFTTAPAPAVAGAALAALRLLADDPDPGARVQGMARRLREQLRAAGFDTGASQTHILPVMVGGNEEAMRVAAALRERGILAPAIRPPTVPDGTARIRISICHDHTEADLDLLCNALIQSFDCAGVARCPR